MVTAAVFYHLLNALNITINVRNTCVFLAPVFSSLTTLVTFNLTKEIMVGALPHHSSPLPYLLSPTSSPLLSPTSSPPPPLLSSTSSPPPPPPYLFPLHHIPSSPLLPLPPLLLSPTSSPLLLSSPLLSSPLHYLLSFSLPPPPYSLLLILI